MAVYYYFRRGQSAVWGQLKLNEALNRVDRLAANRAATPSLVCVDSQSVKLAPRIFEHRGTDGGNALKGAREANVGTRLLRNSSYKVCATSQRRSNARTANRSYRLKTLHD